MTFMTKILGVMSLFWQGGGGLAGSLKSYSFMGAGETITYDNDHDHDCHYDHDCDGQYDHNHHDHHYHLHHFERCHHD